jgi:hypothetical protein
MEQLQPNQRSQDQPGTDATVASPEPFRPKEGELENASSDLRRLERRDWWRLSFVLLVVAVLAAGISFLASYAAGNRDVMHESEVHIAVTGLMAVIAIFVLFTIYQQVTIVGLRRQVAAQVGMLATLELLRPAVREEKPTLQRRQFQRFYFDALLSVDAATKRGTIYGRISDVSEGGIGAVLPEPLGGGTSVRIEFLLPGGNGQKFRAHALVRHRRGFYHGMEFQHMTAVERNALKSICANASPVDALADYLARG